MTGPDDVDSELVDRFGEACYAVFRTLKRGRGTVGKRAKGEALTEAQVGVLESVAQRGPLSVGAIAYHAGLAQPTVSRMLNTLERDGIVRRSGDPNDERTKLVDLSVKGRELWSAKRELLRHYQRDALLRWTPEHRMVVLSVLEELVEIIEEQIAERADSDGLPVDRQSSTTGVSSV